MESRNQDELNKIPFDPWFFIIFIDLFIFTDKSIKTVKHKS